LQFIVEGCYLDTTKISTRSALATEFTTDLILVFLSIGAGLDPQKMALFGPSLGPIFCGLILGVCIFATGFTRPGYTGFCKKTFFFK
jgi:hypothetical protein